MMYEERVKWLPPETIVQYAPGTSEFDRRVALDEIGQVIRRIRLNGATGIEIQALCTEGNDTSFVVKPLKGHIVDLTEQKSGEGYSITKSDVLEGTVVRKATPDTSIEVLLVLNPVN